MSRIGKLPVTVPAGVRFSLEDDRFVATGPKGELHLALVDRVIVSAEGDDISVRPRNEKDRHCLAMWGTMRAQIANIVEGVSKGFEKSLELVGVGYRARMRGRDIELNLGFSHPVLYSAREGISIKVPIPTEIVIQGASKQQVGQTAAEIRRFRPPEPYKGKGVRYKGEAIRRKEGKKK